MKIKYYRQPPVRGGRSALPACVLHEIYEEVEYQAKKFKVSRSFVIATALAHTFGIKDQPDYKRAGKEAKSKLEK